MGYILCTAARIVRKLDTHTEYVNVYLKELSLLFMLHCKEVSDLNFDKF